MRELKWLLYYLVVQFLIFSLFVFIYTYIGYDTNDIVSIMNNSSIYITIIMALIFIPLLVFNYKKNYKDDKLNSVYKFIILGFSLSLIYNFFGFYLDKLLDTNLYGEFNIIETIIQTVILGPIIEEYLFRGMIYNGLKKNFNDKKSMIITSIVFAITHINIIQMIYAFLLNIILVKVYEKYKNINSCIIIHSISNLTTTFITIFLVKNNLILNILIFLIGIYSLKIKKVI